MAEVGINIAKEFPKPWTDDIVKAADVVITMGCGDACPIFPGKRYLNWELDDPAGQDVQAVRPIRDDIGRRTRGLLAGLGVTDRGLIDRCAATPGCDPPPRNASTVRVESRVLSHITRAARSTRRRLHSTGRRGGCCCSIPTAGTALRQRRRPRRQWPNWPANPGGRRRHRVRTAPRRRDGSGALQLAR